MGENFSKLKEAFKEAKEEVGRIEDPFYDYRRNCQDLNRLVCRAESST